MLQIKPLSAELQKVAIEELGEVPTRLPEDLQALKSWIEKQPHLKARTDDQFLVQFLRGCKYSLEKAKDKLDHFYTWKTNCSELFLTTDVDDPTFRRFHNVGSFIVLPKPLNDCGPRMFFIRYNYDPQDFSIETSIRHGAAVTEILMLNDPYACIYGTVYVFDFDKVTTAYLMLLTPGLFKKLILYFEKTLPLRIKCICMINLSPYAEKIIKMLLQYASEKLKQRVFLCGKDIDSLSQQIPLKYFPQDYGGENGSLDHLCAEYNQTFDQYREYFKQNASYGTDERLRCGKKTDVDGEIGYGGSFRKLEVD